MRLALLLSMIAACGDPSDRVPTDAFENVPPSFDWLIWGKPCSRPFVGIEPCIADDGQTGGLCVLTGAPDSDDDGLYPGVCVHECFPMPPFTAGCPDDAVAINEINNAQGCWCQRR